jgi:hypothetical protein
VIPRFVSQSNSFIGSLYRQETLEAAAQIKRSGNLTLASRALYISKEIGTFLWLADNAGPTTNLNAWLAEAARVQKLTGKKQVVQIEVYNLPDRDCSAKAVSTFRYLWNSRISLHIFLSRRALESSAMLTEVCSFQSGDRPPLQI